MRFPCRHDQHRIDALRIERRMPIRRRKGALPVGALHRRRAARDTILIQIAHNRDAQCIHSQQQSVQHRLPTSSKPYGGNSYLFHLRFSS